MKRLALLSLLFLAACKHPSMHPTTTAPPGAVAEYYENGDTGDGTIRVTEGVAMALECEDKDGHTCSLDGSAMGDESIASYKRAYGDLEQKLVYSQSGNKSYENRSLFVVVGKKVGKTQLRVVSGNGDVTIAVEVVPR